MVTVKKNKLSDIFQHPPKWPVYILSIFTLLVMGMTYVGFSDSHKQLAIVIADKAAVQTVPGENKSVIFEAQAGLELEVLNADADFFQVRYPGAFSGWVKRSQLELLSLSFRQ